MSKYSTHVCQNDSENSLLLPNNCLHESYFKTSNIHSDLCLRPERSHKEFQTKMEKISEEENFLGFTEDQVEEFREVFTIFDKDKNGIIDIKEMGVVMRALGQDPSRQRLEEIIREFDENKDGVISFDEFLELMAAMINKVDEVSY